jgi:hypothetical protein
MLKDRAVLLQETGIPIKYLLFQVVQKNILMWKDQGKGAIFVHAIFISNF